MRKCSKCGAENPEYSVYCGSCGNEVSAADSVSSVESPSPAKTEQSVAPEQRKLTTPPQLMKCMYCGREVNSTTLFCPFCGKNPRGPWAGGSDYEPSSYEPSDSSYSEDVVVGSGSASGGLVLGGVLAIIAGLLALGQGVLYAGVGSSFASVAPTGSLCLCGGIDIIFGLGSLFGGVFAIQRKQFALSLLGAILGIFGLGLLVGALLGLIATVLIAVSKNEFES